MVSWSCREFCVIGKRRRTRFIGDSRNSALRKHGFRYTDLPPLRENIAMLTLGQHCGSFLVYRHRGREPGRHDGSCLRRKARGRA